MIKRNIICLLLCIATLGGCNSMRQIAYRYADWFIVREIDSCFDLTAEQKKFLKPRISAAVDRFRSDIAVDLVVWLLEAKARVARGLTHDDLVWSRAQWANLRARVLLPLLPDAAAFLAQLSEEQVDYFGRRLAESNQRLIAMLEQSDAKFFDFRRSRYIDNLKKWSGSYNDAQLEILFAHAGGARISLRSYLQDRQSAQAAFLELLRHRATPDHVVEQLRIWVESPELMRSPKDRSAYQERIAAQNNLALALDKTLSLEQRVFLLAQFDDVIEILRD